MGWSLKGFVIARRRGNLCKGTGRLPPRAPLPSSPSSKPPSPLQGKEHIVSATENLSLQSSFQNLESQFSLLTTISQLLTFNILTFNCNKQIASLCLPAGRQAYQSVGKLAMTGKVLSSVRVECRQAFCIENRFGAHRLLLDTILLRRITYLPVGRLRSDDNTSSSLETCAERSRSTKGGGFAISEDGGF